MAAEIAGVNSATINQWLSGSQPNDPIAVLKLCKALRSDFQWLLTGTPRPSQKVEELALLEIFEMQDEADFSGIYMIEAKKLKRKL